MSASFTNQVLAQIELWENAESYDRQVYARRSIPTRKSQAHPRSCVNLTQLSDKQAEYIGVGSEGPFKPEAYRY